LFFLFFPLLQPYMRNNFTEAQSALALKKKKQINTAVSPAPFTLFLFSFLSTSRGSTLWLAEAYPMASAFMGFLPFPALESIERSSLYNTL
jgi:hypothetical protein